MSGLIKAGLCALAIALLTRNNGKKMHLDTALFMHRNEHKTMESMNRLLSSMNVEDLSQADIKRLAEYSGDTVRHFMDEYVVTM